MINAAKPTDTTKAAGGPGWIQDKDNQKKWNGQFIELLKRDYLNLDLVISAILSNEKLSQECATKIRLYVDRDVTICLNEQRKLRGAKHKKQLGIAISGLRAAVDLFMSRGKQELALRLSMLEDEFVLELGRCKEAFATKRHGRDRAHSILFECHSFLESELQQSVTNATLANLVNIGYEADGHPPKEPVTEEQIRRNLANFKRNSPFWRNSIDSRFQQLADPETK